MVEGANAGLKNGFVNVERKFVRVLGLTKVTVMLAFTLAGYNIERIRSFLARRVAAAAQAVTGGRTRAMRRKNTWSDLLGARDTKSGQDPPPG